MYLLNLVTVLTTTLALAAAIPHAQSQSLPQGSDHMVDIDVDKNVMHAPGADFGTNGAEAETEADPRFAHVDLDTVHPHAEIHTKRSGVYGFYECANSFWKGPCKWTQIMPGDKTCHNRLYGPNGSFGPDKGVSCTVYDHEDCDEKYIHSGGFAYPGSGLFASDTFFASLDMYAGPLSWKCDVI